MTALIVIGIIVLLFALLLNIKLSAEIKYYGGKLDFKVKYMWFTIFPLKPRKKPKRKRKKEAAEEQTADTKENTAEGQSADINENTAENAVSDSGENISVNETDTKNAEKKKLSEKLNENLDKIKDLIEKAKLVWSASQKGLKRIFRHIYLDDLVIDFIVADEDAYKAAISYGTVSAVTYNAISAVRLLFPITVKTVDIICDFDRKTSVYDGEVKITVRPSTLISAAFSILLGLVKVYYKLKVKNNTKAETESTASA